MYVVLKSWMLKTNWRIRSERSWRPKSWREGPHTLPIIDSWIDYYFINYFNVITTPSSLYACYSCDCYLWPWLMHSRFDKSNFQLWLFIKSSKHLCWLYVDDICLCDKNTSDTKNLPREVNRGHQWALFLHWLCEHVECNRLVSSLRIPIQHIWRFSTFNSRATNLNWLDVVLFQSSFYF